MPETRLTRVGLAFGATAYCRPWHPGFPVHSGSGAIQGWTFDLMRRTNGFRPSPGSMGQFLGRVGEGPHQTHQTRALVLFLINGGETGMSIRKMVIHWCIEKACIGRGAVVMTLINCPGRGEIAEVV